MNSNKKYILKFDLLANGMSVSNAASKQLLNDSSSLTASDYPTTNGITMELPGGAYVNVPIDASFAKNTNWTLDWNLEAESFVLNNGKEKHKVRVLPLPSYIGKTDSKGKRFDQVVMTHGDRFRLSPVEGCSFRCAFCDSHLKNYHIHERSFIDAAIDTAMNDTNLPPRHALISGGTPKPEDVLVLVKLIENLIEKIPLPVDVMCTPALQKADLVRRFAGAGGYELSINIELFGEEAIKRFAPQKADLSKKAFSDMIEQAVNLLDGRVRSLLIVGLEPLEYTLKGVEWLCERGCQPVLSPFRPAPNTALADSPKPSVDLLYEAWKKSMEIANRYGLSLGPKCIPCQNNCLAFPPEFNEIDL
jgi:hypothetical protein